MRHALIVPIVAALALVGEWAGAAEIGSPTISAAERARLPVVIVAPGGGMRSTTRSTLLRILDEVAKANTVLEPFELMSAQDCVDDVARRDRFRCIGLSSPPGEKVDLILVVSIAPRDDGDRILTVLLDAQTARALVAPDSKVPAAEAEAAIRREAIVARSEPTTTKGPEAVEQYVRHLFERALRPTLEQRGYWAGFGAIDIRSDVAGFEVLLDGRLLGGLTAAPITRIIEVRPGRRTITLRHRLYRDVETTVKIEARGVGSWEPAITLRPSDQTTFNQIVLWSGVSVAAAGAVVAVLGATASRDSKWGCYNPDCGFRSVSKPLSVTGDPGLSFAGLGLGLLLAGTTTAVLNLVLGNDERSPWLEIFAGVGAGGAGFTTMFLIDRSAAAHNDGLTP